MDPRPPVSVLKGCKAAHIAPEMKVDNLLIFVVTSIDIYEIL